MNMETIDNRYNEPLHISARFQPLFPQVVVSGALELPEADRARLSRYIRERQSAFKKRKRDNVVFEESPMGLHSMPEFDLLFQRVGALVGGSLSRMGLSPSHLNFYVVRSWANSNTEGMITANHNHLNSHISVVYYPDSSCDQATINFHGGIEQCWVPSYNTAPYEKAGLHNGSNPLSANFYSIRPREDLCLVFPSSLVHGVSPNQSANPRISIAMDGLFTLKEYTRDEPLLPPPNTWRRL
jgi:uncharacterized protein (TIGR02466 family)